jgi:hypothetical protein
MTEQKLFVVVCKDLHAAVGLFTSAADAVKIAKAMNAKTKCDHVPVPLSLFQNSEVQTKRSETEVYVPKGYL